LPPEYQPPIFCKCGRKAPRWISWSELNPGRRNYTCMRRRGQVGSCDFWLWFDFTTTHFLRQLLTDLRHRVWGLTKENAKLRASISEAKGAV
ncbi:hypothetical protein BAE44_0015450, partial [Dichanthelium oligosanthes]